MSCACENKRYSGEYKRIWQLAKALAVLEECTVALFKKDDGTFDFTTDTEIDKPIVEYISPY